MGFKSIIEGALVPRELLNPLSRGSLSCERVGNGLRGAAFGNAFRQLVVWKDPVSSFLHYQQGHSKGDNTVEPRQEKEKCGTASDSLSPGEGLWKETGAHTL